MSKRDQEWMPSQAVRAWARNYAQKKYQRRTGGRLVKLDNKSAAESQREVDELSQATGLSISVENLVSKSEPVSRAHSSGELQLGNTSKAAGVEKSRKRHHSEQGSSSIPLTQEPIKVIEKDATETKMAEVEEVLRRLAVSVKKNNHKLLPPLPYFNGKAEKVASSTSQQAPWIEYNCDEFLSMIEDAVDNDNWTEAGKIRTLQDRLLGSAREYWKVRGRDVDTLRKARDYLMLRFPNTETYASLNNQIAEFKRRQGETTAEKATRIQLLFTKLGKVAPETKHSQKISMKELFFKDLPETVRDQVSSDDDYDTAVRKSIEYLERHKEYKLRNRDVQLESTFRSESKVSNINASGKGTGTNEKKKNKENIKKESQNKQQKSQDSGSADASINNVNSSRGYHQNQRGFRGGNRRSFRNRGYRSYRGRGSYRDDYQSSRGQGGSYRGYQGFQRGFRNRGNRRGNRGYHNEYDRSQTYDSRRVTCQDCGKFGHSSRQCLTRDQNVKEKTNNDSSNAGSRTNTSNCFNCGSDMHWARNCPQKN